ncbi:hypothetical protein CH063_03510, partial [Colletotrichum higginsianum]
LHRRLRHHQDSRIVFAHAFEKYTYEYSAEVLPFNTTFAKRQTKWGRPKLLSGTPPPPHPARTLDPPKKPTMCSSSTQTLVNIS